MLRLTALRAAIRLSKKGFHVLSEDSKMNSAQEAFDRLVGNELKDVNHADVKKVALALGMRVLLQMLVLFVVTRLV